LAWYYDDGQFGAVVGLNLLTWDLVKIIAEEEKSGGVGEWKRRRGDFA
jgi:hypothetical protein